MSAEVVPFGKYRGQPVEVLAADHDYCEWLTAQPWFKARYLNVYNTVINYGAEPQDSPEHNQMQARFLDDEWCFKLADLLTPSRRGTYGLEAARKLLAADPSYQKFRDCCELETVAADVNPRLFEDRGWDVTYSIGPASIRARRTKLVPPLPACTCICDHSECSEDSPCRGGTDFYGCRHRNHEKREIDGSNHCRDDCYWSYAGPLGGYSVYSGSRDTLRGWLKEVDHFYQPSYPPWIQVELKPDLGDDYPSVLRQVKNYPKYESGGSRRCVIARRHAFQSVTWEQVVRIFAASNIVLLAEGEIESAPAPSLAEPPPDPEGHALSLVKDRLGAKPVAASDLGDGAA
jgi:hypothetical protein